MKILMLTPYLPYPLLSGGQIRSYNLLKNLAYKHEITLVSLIKHSQEKKYIPQIEKYCQEVIAAKKPEKPWTLLNIIRTGFGNYPFLVVRNFSRQASQAVIDELEKEEFDLIHAETFYVMPHIPETSIPILLVEQTVEYLVYKHFVEGIKLWPVRKLLSVDVEKIKYWEQFYWQKAKMVVAMSESDKQVMAKQVQGLDVSIVPNGVDEVEFKFRKRVPRPDGKILFVGNFKWLQNREAVNYLVKQIWPLIKAKLPRIKLWIVGRFPSTEIINFQDRSIKVSDNIDDIRVAYNQSDVLLAPIYGPGGTRYKILEAMASGVPVVTTPQGIEGLGVKDGVEALVRKDVVALAEATIKLISHQGLYAKMAEKANKLVRKNYSWSSIATTLDKLYERVAHETAN